LLNKKTEHVVLVCIHRLQTKRNRFHLILSFTFFLFYAKIQTKKNNIQSDLPFVFVVAAVI